MKTLAHHGCLGDGCPICPRLAQPGYEQVRRRLTRGHGSALPPDAIVLAMRANSFNGLGDHFALLCAAEGLRRQQDRPVAVATPRPDCAEFAGLFWDPVVPESAVTRGAGQVLYLFDGYREAEQNTRYDYLAERCHTSAAVPRLLKPPSAEARAWATEYARAVVLAPHANANERTWPRANWLELERLLVARGRRVVVIDRDRDRIAAFDGTKLAGESAERVTALMLAAACVVGNDSGMVSLAGMLGVRGVVLCGVVRGHKFYGLWPSVTVLDGSLACTGCAWTGADRDRAGCANTCASLYGIHPQQALAAIETTAAPADYAHLQALRSIVQAHRPCSYLEIGVGSGTSLRAVLEAAPSVDRLALFDRWEPWYAGKPSPCDFGHVRAMLARLRYAGTVQMTAGDSRATLPAFTAGRSAPFDLILVDGDHTEEGLAADLANVVPLLAPGGHLVVDDTAMPDWPALRPRTLAVAAAEGLDVTVDDQTLPNGVIVLRRPV